MRVERLASPEDLLGRAGPFLLRQEALHCLLLDATAWFPPAGMDTDPPYIVTVEDLGEVVAVAARVAPFGMIVSDARPAGPERTTGSIERAVLALARDMILHDIEPISVLGPRVMAAMLARAWGQATGATARLAREHVVYQVDRGGLRPVHGVPGTAVPVTTTWLDLLAAWVVAFTAEALGGDEPGTTPDEARARVDRAIAGRGRGVLAWTTGGEPVAMAMYGGPTATGIRITSVYTPPEHRNRGYASALVAATCKSLMDWGKERCFLLADAANPASNRTYRKVGFVPAGWLDKHSFTYPGSD